MDDAADITPHTFLFVLQIFITVFSTVALVGKPDVTEALTTTTTSSSASRMCLSFPSLRKRSFQGIESYYSVPTNVQIHLLLHDVDYLTLNRLSPENQENRHYWYASKPDGTNVSLWDGGSTPGYYNPAGYKALPLFNDTLTIEVFSDLLGGQRIQEFTFHYESVCENDHFSFLLTTELDYPFVILDGLPQPPEPNGTAFWRLLSLNDEMFVADADDTEWVRFHTQGILDDPPTDEEPFVHYEAYNSLAVYNLTTPSNLTYGQELYSMQVYFPDKGGWYNLYPLTLNFDQTAFGMVLIFFDPEDLDSTSVGAYVAPELNSDIIYGLPLPTDAPIPYPTPVPTPVPTPIHNPFVTSEPTPSPVAPSQPPTVMSTSVPPPPYPVPTTASAQTSSSPQSSQEANPLSGGWIVFFTLCIFLVIIVCVLAAVIIVSRHRRKEKKEEKEMKEIEAEEKARDHYIYYDDDGSATTSSVFAEGDRAPLQYDSFIPDDSQLAEFEAMKEQRAIEKHQAGEVRMVKVRNSDATEATLRDYSSIPKPLDGNEDDEAVATESVAPYHAEGFIAEEEEDSTSERTKKKKKKKTSSTKVKRQRQRSQTHYEKVPRVRAYTRVPSMYGKAPAPTYSVEDEQGNVKTKHYATLDQIAQKK